MKKLFQVTVDVEEEKAKALDADHIEDCLFNPLHFSEKWRGCVTVTEVVTPTLNGVPLVTEPCLGAEGPTEEVYLGTFSAAPRQRTGDHDDPVRHLGRAGR